MVDELLPSAIDRGKTTARHHAETRHPQQCRFGMRLLGREGLDVHLLQGAAVDLAPRVSTLPRRIIRSREANDHAIAAADTSDAARSAHGQAPAQNTIFARGLPNEPLRFVARSRRTVQSSGDFFVGKARGEPNGFDSGWNTLPARV